MDIPVIIVLTLGRGVALGLGWAVVLVVLGLGWGAVVFVVLGLGWWTGLLVTDVGGSAADIDVRNWVWISRNIM